MLWLFDNRLHMMLLVKGYYAKTLRVIDLIAEHRCPGCFSRRALHQLGQAAAIKDIVAENQAHRIIANEVSPDNESFRQAIWLFLYFVTNIESQLFTVF